MKTAQVGLGVVLVGALAGLVYMSGGKMPGANPLQGEQQAAVANGTEHKPTCAIATEQQATKLMLRLFPESLIISAEPYPIHESACLLEVYMQVDKNEPGTKGFVYVLPDGEHFLNGPLMDKRSDVGLKVASDVKQIKEARAEQARILQQRPNPIGGVSPIPEPANAAPAKPVSEQPQLLLSPEQMRQEVLAKLSSLPALTTGSPGKPVYALVDPLCGACTNLYNQHAELSTKYGMQFHWIPLYTSERGWVMSALLLKTAKTDRQAALDLLDRMMRGNWKEADHKDEISKLTPEDFAESKKSFTVYYEFAQSVPGTRTPVVAYEAPNVGVQLFVGLPIEDDWLPLLGYTPPAPQLSQQ